MATKQANKQAAKLADARRLTLREAAQHYFNQHESKWRSAKHREAFLSTLRAFVFPVLGDMDVATIETPDILRAIEPIWKTKSITADRTRNRIEQVMDWCVVRGHRPPGTNPARWKGHLDQVLPAPHKVAPVEHHAAMKGNREHRVPLSSACIDLLRKLPRDPGNPFIFIGPRSGSRLSKMSMTYVMRALGQGDGKTIIHGFRSSFSNFSHERTAHTAHTIEISLAHNVGNEVERAYRRTDMIAKRRQLMEQWSKFCAAMPPTKVSGRLMRAVEKQHDRDVETIAGLVRTLREPKGRQIPLAHELKQLIRKTLKEEI